MECSGGKGKCDAGTEPQATTSCNLGACPEWKVGAWSQVKSSGTIFESVTLEPQQSILTVSENSSSQCYRSVALCHTCYC